MADLRHQERLQPSLLDRLIDEEPENKQEPVEKRVLSLRQLREAVLRDLSWLFNAGNLASAQNLEAFPEVANSVLNYGIPDFTGHAASGVDVTAIEHLLRKAICDFEPRILRHSVKVRLIVDEQKMSHNAMMFDIEGVLWAHPVPLHIFLKTELDLEVGDVKVSDYTGAF